MVSQKGHRPKEQINICSMVLKIQMRVNSLLEIHRLSCIVGKLPQSREKDEILVMIEEYMRTGDIPVHGTDGQLRSSDDILAALDDTVTYARKAGYGRSVTTSISNMVHTITSDPQVKRAVHEALKTRALRSGQ